MKENSEINKQKRVLYFDLLNICACFCVIALHCNGMARDFSNTLAWKQALFVEVFAFWAVPIFLMLSGATLLEYRKRYNTKEFFKKRFYRILIPFIIWSVFAAFANRYFANNNVFSLRGFVRFIFDIFNSNIENIYWFFIPLFIIYLTIPFFSLITTANDGKKSLWYGVFFAFILNSFIPTIFSLMNINLQISYNFPQLASFLIFPILGYLLSKEELRGRTVVIIFIIGLLSALFRYIVTYFMTVKKGEIYLTLFDYYQFHSILFAAGVFCFFKYINWESIFKSSKVQKNISIISSCSFGIYLIHMFFLRFVIHFLPSNFQGWPIRILGPFIIYFFALIIVLILKKIPVLKKIVP